MRPEAEPALAEAAGALAHKFGGRQQRSPSLPAAVGPKNTGGPTTSLRRGARELEIGEIETRAFPVVRRGYDRDEVDAFLRAVAQSYGALLDRAQDAEEHARRAMAEPPAVGAFEDLGGRVAAVLRSASDVAEGLKTEAEEEAAAIRQKAHADVEHVRRDASERLAEAERIRVAAEQEAERLLASARSVAASIVTTAREKAAEVEQLATTRAAALERTVQANVDAIVAEARRDLEHLVAAEQQCMDHLASVEFLAKHAREGLAETFGQSFDERLERMS